MVTECPRHGRGFLPPKDEVVRRGHGYYVVRCVHIGDRCVIQVNSHDERYMTVDYVEFVPGGGVRVEAYSPGGSGAAEDYWDELVARMRADDPPVPDDMVVAAW